MKHKNRNSLWALSTGHSFQGHVSAWKLLLCPLRALVLKFHPQQTPTPKFLDFYIKNAIWRTALICVRHCWIQYSIVLFSISFCLYRDCFTHLISSNLSCYLCLRYYDQLVHFNKEINAKVYHHSLWEYSKRSHCSFEWHLTPHNGIIYRNLY